MPTAAEAGLPNFQPLINVNNILVPRATPQEIVDKINQDVTTIALTPDFRESMRKQGYTATRMTVAETDRLIDEAIRNSTELARALNIKPE